MIFNNQDNPIRLVYLFSLILYRIATNTDKQIVIVDQLTPKTQPGGVHGALFIVSYHSDDVPGSVHNEPKDNSPKLMNRDANKINAKSSILLSFFISWIVVLQF